MYLDRLRLFQYRSYSEIETTFDPSFNVILGFNGQGKTNLIESVGILSFYKSFRGAKNQELIKIGTLESRIQGHIIHNDLDFDLDVKIWPTRKQASFNGKSCKLLSEYVGRVSAVSFSPTDLEIVRGAPEVRRDWIDKFSQVFFNTHTDLIKNYQDALQQRNRILKNISQNKTQRLPDDFDVWTEQLVTLGAQIVLNRKTTGHEITNAIEQHYNIISELKTSIKLKYLHANLSDETDGQTAAELAIFIHEALKKNLDRDCVLGSTSVGPHRDDIAIFMNDTMAKSFSSQGEVRSIVLAMRLAEVEKSKEKKGYSPLLLIDDFSSELDSNRRKFLLNYLLNSGSQVFLTTTEELKIGKVFVIDQGRVLVNDNEYTTDGRIQL